MEAEKTEVWFAVQTWPRYEKKVKNELERKGFEVFLPLEISKRQWSDRTEDLQLPLFPTYVFLRASDTLSRIPALRTNGVIGFVGSTSFGTPIPDSEIESVRTLLSCGICFQPYPFMIMKIGQRFRICEGSLSGVEGVLLAKNEDLSLVLSISLVQRSLAITVSGYRLEAA
ncbi:MAG TPA: transcription termination/antitermination NusG family protein [Candidatus Acidoferrales bacterium]|nr:transcription termination/antitermination NusG family protein [Candidatus Acidoferrales bacterium]